MSRLTPVLAGICAALTLNAIAGPASATSDVSAPRPSAGIQGIGFGVHPRIDTAMYAGPGLSTPRIGTAWQGDNVGAACRILDNNNKRLVLGIERPGRNGVQWANTAGYIWDLDIRENTDSLPDCLGTGRVVHAWRDTAMYSGPGLSTPRIGTAWLDDPVIGVCKITDNNNKRLVLGIERPGRDGSQWANTAGYIWDLDIRENTDSLPDCGLT